MAITLLASRGKNAGSAGVSGAGAANSPTLAPSSEKTKNNGGLLGGIGYVGEKLAVSVVSSLEGITDYVGSGFAKLFGNDEWAEEVIKNDWFGDWYSHPEQWFNPDKGWQFAGDVVGGIGTSLPAICAALGTTAAIVATGGAAAPVIAAASGGASFLTAGLGAAGRSTKEAYEESGELSGKEFGYGALTGITEGGIEAVSNVIGMGSGALVKNISKSFAKETGEAIAKQGILKTLGASFAGEAFEEGVSEWIDPYWKRATYDKNAENASLDQIAYSALVGGFSGMLMGGTGYVYDSGKSFINGNRLSQNGGDTEVIETARYFSAFEEQNQTGDEVFTEIKSLSESLAESLKTTGGKVTTVGQKRQLGALSRANVAASMKSFVAKRAVNIVNNAPVIAERLSTYGYKTPDGKPVSFTAQEITAGYDPANPGSIFSALKSNEKLRSLAVADATGQLMIDSAKFTQATLTGERLASQVDLDRFVETASREEIAAVSQALNIESWSELTSESFAEKITEYINNGGVQQTIRTNEIKSALKAMPVEGARPIPKLINLASDGSRRYSDGELDIAVSKQGDSYTIYNYSTDTLSKSMTRKEINAFLREYSTKKEAVLERESAQIKAAEQVKAEIAEVDSYARENIKDYAGLNASSQSMIRRVIREGRAKGVNESDLLAFAKISAHSGLDIVFSKEQNYLGAAEDGSAKYADGFYEVERNRIVVNPEGKRSYERLLIHELDHAIRRYLGEDGKVHTTVFKGAIEGVSSEEREKILKTYKSVAASEGRAATVMDETNAYYAEQVLTNRNTLERLIEAEPSLKNKFLSFFKGASGDYADIPKLSAAAKKYYRTYKKLFDEFSARNAQNNAAENAEFRMESAEFNKNAEKSQKTSLTNINQRNMNVSGENVRYYAFNDAYSEKDSIKSQLRQNESTVNNMNPVDDINYDVVDKKKSREDAKQLYKSLGYRIDRQNFGIIEISEKEINESSNYLNTKAEFAAWMTVPKVLKRGKLISDHSDHKGGGFPTYTIAAPVIINGVRGNVAVAVKKTGKNRYKTHRILMPDGSQFVYEKNKTNAEPTGSDIILSNKNKGSDISSASINSISQKSANSNPSGENNSKKQFALELDSSGKELSAEQKEYFKDSKVRDANERLLTVYHGTNNDFYTFEDGHTRTKTRLNFGRGFYFSASRSMAENYIDGSEGRLLECFINLKNPYEVYSNRFDQSDYDAISKLAGETVNVDNVSATLRDLGYDGVIGRKYNGASNPIEIAVAFSPEQIKLTSNASPTNNPDIRYALDIDSETDGISGAEVMGWLKDKQKDGGRSKRSENDGFYADGEEFATPTLSTVGKERLTYSEKAFSRDWLFTKSTSAYIHGVDEMYGIQVYLEKVGKVKNAKAVIQAVRSAPHQAQSMIGSVQYNVFEGNAKTAKKIGEGLNEIFRPIEKQGEAVSNEFNDYLLHYLNVDKYEVAQKISESERDASESLARVREEISGYEDQRSKIEERILGLGYSDGEKALKNGLKKSIESIEREIVRARADEIALLGESPSYADAELKRARNEIAEFLGEKNKYQAEILSIKNKGDSEINMKREGELLARISNIDLKLKRLEESAAAIEEIARAYKISLKPVFGINGKTISKHESEKIIKNYETRHPDFKKTAQKVWAFNKNLNKMRVSAGLISQSMSQRLAVMYPHYVPAFRSQINNTTVSDEGVSVTSTVKRAKGYNSEIVNVKDSIASQVSQVMRNGNINALANKVYDAAAKSGDVKYVDINLPDAEGAERSTDGINRPKPHTLTFFRKGVEYQINVSDEIYLGFKGISEASAPHTNVFARVTNWITDKYKKLVTSWSPAFMIRNAIRDMQDAGLNSKHPMLFAKNISRAWVEMAKNSDNWQTYRAYGGFSSTVFDSKGVKGDVGARGFEVLGISERIASGEKLSAKDFKYLGSLLTGVENVNAAVEQIPRFAEYLASLDSGETIEQAIYNSAEVTTNFARRGATTKSLNSTIIPFLNPAIQGFDKIFRNVTDAAKAGNGKDVAKAFGTLISKAVLIGMLPMLFNSLMYDDDEDYANLREEDKENNYLIKLADGTFIKLPRGRVASVIAGLYNRTIKTVKGEDADWAGYASNVVSQVTPAENLTRTIFSPFMDVSMNRTWYGTEIEGAQFDNVRPKDRYDESTSEIAIAIGQAINYSPKKIHYLIDQYSGVIGDFLLSATTKKAEKDFFSGNFTLDSVTSNKLSTQFYELYDEAQYSKTDSDTNAIYQFKYLNKVKSSISELYSEINAIQNSELSDYEKLQQTRVLRIMINEAMKNAISDFVQIGTAINQTESMDIDNTKIGDVNIRYAEIIRQVYGAERALYEYNSTVYSNLSVLNTAGLSYDKLYDYYFGTKGIESDVDANGETISGSKRKKVVAAISSLGVTTEQKLLLICASGYALKDGDIRGASASAAKKRLLRYIINLRGLTVDERSEIAEMCGFEVKNGRIVKKLSFS